MKTLATALMRNSETFRLGVRLALIRLRILQTLHNTSFHVQRIYALTCSAIAQRLPSNSKLHSLFARQFHAFIMRNNSIEDILVQARELNAITKSQWEHTCQADYIEQNDPNHPDNWYICEGCAQATDNEDEHIVHAFNTSFKVCQKCKTKYEYQD